MFRFRSLLVAGAAAALVGALAPAAFADTPSPDATPSVAAPVVTPTPSHVPFRHLRFRAERFVIHSSTLEPAGDGVFAGPVRGASVGNFEPGTDVESLTGPVGVVQLFHTPLGPLTVDLPSCTATLHQTGRWVLLGVSGADRRAFGFGTYTADVVALLARGPFGGCLGLRVPPVDVDVHVLGVGRALQLRPFVLFPRVTPALTPAA